MKNYAKFCPNCNAPDKMVKKCAKCRRVTCKECSMPYSNKSYCVDCYVKVTATDNVKVYFDEKYNGKLSNVMKYIYPYSL